MVVVVPDGQVVRAFMPHRHDQHVSQPVRLVLRTANEQTLPGGQMQALLALEVFSVDTHTNREISQPEVFFFVAGGGSPSPL